MIRQLFGLPVACGDGSLGVAKAFLAKDEGLQFFNSRHAPIGKTVVVSVFGVVELFDFVGGVAEVKGLRFAYAAVVVPRLPQAATHPYQLRIFIFDDVRL